MIKAVIIDDEPKSIRILTNLISKFCPQVEVAGGANNGKKGIEIIRKEKPDLVFLDIEMPHGNAFDILDQLQPVNFEIIFVTAFDNYSLKAFKYSALDYLLKPVDIDELKIAVTKAAERIRMKNTNQPQLEFLINNLLKQQTFLSKLALPSKDGLIFIAIDDIIRCEASAGYTNFYLQGNEKILSARNIKEYEELLPEPLFFRTHNSHIINLKHIKKYHRGRGGYIEMADGTFIEVATRRKEEFLARFGVKS